jgi:hypothetical protein
MPQPLQIDIFSLTRFNTLLLVLSLAVTVGILRGAARDNVRTAIESLDDVALGGDRKLVPMLHRFHYRGIDRYSSCEVLIKQYAETEVGSVPEDFLEHIELVSTSEQEIEDEQEQFKERIADTIARVMPYQFDNNLSSYIEDVEYSPDGLIIEIETKNPVYIKRIVDTAMSGIRAYISSKSETDGETEQDEAEVETE